MSLGNGCEVHRQDALAHHHLTTSYHSTTHTYMPLCLSVCLQLSQTLQVLHAYIASHRSISFILHTCVRILDPGPIDRSSKSVRLPAEEPCLRLLLYFITDAAATDVCLHMHAVLLTMYSVLQARCALHIHCLPSLVSTSVWWYYCFAHPAAPDVRHQGASRTASYTETSRVHM